MDVSENSGTPKSSIFNRGFHYKPSILGCPFFWKHPIWGSIWYCIVLAKYIIWYYCLPCLKNQINMCLEFSLLRHQQKIETHISSKDISNCLQVLLKPNNSCFAECPWQVQEHPDAHVPVSIKPSSKENKLEFLPIKHEIELIWLHLLNKIVLLRTEKAIRYVIKKSPPEQKHPAAWYVSTLLHSTKERYLSWTILIYATKHESAGVPSSHQKCVLWGERC